MQAEDQASSEIVINKLQGWWELFITNLPNLAIALVVMIASYFISKLVYKSTLKIAYSRLKQTSITKLIARIASVVVVLGGLFLALGALNLGKTLTTLLSAAGISGLVIGLALQGTLSNLVSGIILSFRKNVRLGNWIESNGFSGEVMDINLNYFVLKEADNNIVIMPNKMMLENPMKNYSLTSKMRITIDCGVGYESDLESVKYIAEQTINSHFDQDSIDKTLEFYYTEFGDSSINFICRFWIEGESGLDKLKAKSKAIIELKKAFSKENINIPFPIRTLQFNQPLSLTKNGQENVYSQN